MEYENCVIKDNKLHWVDMSDISLVEFTVPDNVHIIMSTAFNFCNNLKKLNIPKSVRTIDTDSIMQCPKLTELHIENTKCNLLCHFIGTPYELIYKKFAYNYLDNNNINRVYLNYHDFIFSTDHININLNFLTFLKRFNEDNSIIFKYYNSGELTVNEIKPILKNDYNGFKDGINYGI